VSSSKRKIEDLTPEQLKELEGDWRAGLLSLGVLAAKFRVEPKELLAFARRSRWDGRGDLSAAIQGAATSALMQRAVGQLTGDGLQPDAQETVARYGQIVATVVEEHKADISRARRRVRKYIEELEALDGPDIDEDAISGLIVAIQDQNPELAKLLKRPKKSLLPIVHQIALLDAKAEVVRKLVASEKALIELQRQAWGLDKGEGKGLTYDDYLAELHGETNPNEPKRIN
jgi:hypothetical protein